MKTFVRMLPRAFAVLLAATVVLGVAYPLVILGVGQAFFPYQANGSVIEVDGKAVGSELLAQWFSDDGHMSVEHRRELAVAINDDSIWLGGLVENLLSLTRIEEAHVSLSLEPELVEDAVDDAVRHVSRDVSTHHVELSRPDEPVVAMTLCSA